MGFFWAYATSLVAIMPYSQSFCKLHNTILYLLKSVLSFGKSQKIPSGKRGPSQIIICTQHCHPIALHARLQEVIQLEPADLKMFLSATNPQMARGQIFTLSRSTKHICRQVEFASFMS
jgi:hypothetical protein